MGRLVFLIVLFSFTAAADHIITSSDIKSLFVKFMLNDLTEADSQTLKETLEVLHRPEHVSARSFENSSLRRLGKTLLLSEKKDDSVLRKARKAVGPERHLAFVPILGLVLVYPLGCKSIDCIVCRSAVEALFQNIRDGQSDEGATDTIVTLCTSLGIETYTVCKGAVALNMPIIAHIIRTVPEATPNAFCGLVLQRADSRNFCSFEDPRFEWQVELPAKTDTNPVPVNNSTPLKVAVITDAHIDPLYEPFGVAECDAPTCCRFGQVPARSFYHPPSINESLLEEALVIDNGGMKLNLSVAAEIRRQKTSRTIYPNRRTPTLAGYWGDYRNCDTPIWAYDDAIEHIYEHHKDIDIIYYIGDTIDHGVWETSFELINNMNQYLVDKIRYTFGDNVKVVPAIGNHESQPTNQFAPSRVVGEKLNTTWLYKALVDKWGFYLTDDAKASLLERGDFSMSIRPGLRVISLNNNVAYKYNWWLVYDPLDAKKHLDWLVQELLKAELAGEKVHILAHIPPGVHDLTYTWTREYNRIVNRFSATIAAEFNGHTHSDEFKIFYSPSGAPSNVAWGAGSVTAYTFYNLNYKIATFNPDTFVLDRIVNYAYNLTEANLTPHLRPHWFLLYDMTNSFGLKDLSARSMHDLVYSMVENNKRGLTLYSAFYSKLSDVRWPNCDDNCKIENLCKTVVTVLWERQRCDELRQLFFA